jgi:hypothetical protein
MRRNNRDEGDVPCTPFATETPSMIIALNMRKGISGIRTEISQHKIQSILNLYKILCYHCK